ncbi:hypothetical protein HYQ46_001389 [Verticillium longisporum]|nr:hypothetical protein HYQ46_001389 [Verticillium longisporum]
MACDSTLSLPWKMRWIMDEPGFREAFVGVEGDLLKELVWGYVRFEGARVPDLAHENTRALGELRARAEVLEEKVVS